MKNIIYLLLPFLIFSCSNEEKDLPEDFDYGKTENGFYQNNYFDLEVSFDPTWIVQNQEQVGELMKKGQRLVAGEDEELKSVIKASMITSATLLTIFKHEVGAAVESNPSFLIIAENTAGFPGIKNGKDYLFHSKKLLEQSQLPYYFEKDVIETQIGDSEFHVLEAKLDILGKTIIQEYMTTVVNGFSLSFVISYTNDEERAELNKIIASIKI